MVALGLVSSGCHLIFPFDLSDSGAPADAQADQLVNDSSSADLAAPSDGDGGGGGALTGICPFAADDDTTGLFTFEATSSTTFDNKVKGGPVGALVNLPGFTLQHVAGPPGCGGGGLATPIPHHAATCTACASTTPLHCIKGGYATIPSFGGTKLKQGAIDFWVTFAKAGGQQGVVSRDATGHEEGGHFTVYRHLNGFLVARLQQQGGSTSRGLICSKKLAEDIWYHVGVNFGPGGMELYVNGQRAAEPQMVGGELCGDGKGHDVGIEGNDETWVVGAMAWRSCKGTILPVTEPLKGVVANFRISRVRRDFAKLFSS